MIRLHGKAYVAAPVTGTATDPALASDNGWEHYSYTVTLRHNGASRSFSWRQGLGHDPRKIDLLSVLNSIVLDTDCGLLSFEDFCADLGYDTDSRSARKMWRACQKNGGKLAVLFPRDWELSRVRQLVEGL